MMRDLLTRLREVEQERQLNRLAHQAADLLMVTMQIPEGRSLVPFLTDRRVGSNRQALAAWAATHMDPTLSCLTTDDIKRLGRMLRDHLGSFQEVV